MLFALIFNVVYMTAAGYTFKYHIDQLEGAPMPDRVWPVTIFIALTMYFWPIYWAGKLLEQPYQRLLLPPGEGT